MKCKNCETRPVHKLESGRKLCEKHFIEYFERKVYRTIRTCKLLGKKEKVCVALSGGKDSTATAYLLKKLSDKNPKLKIIAVAIDEGIAGYRKKTLKDAKKFCEEYEIPLTIISFEKELKETTDKLAKTERPCTACGIRRRNLLNKAAKRLECTKLATGHNLDDEAQTMLMNILKGNTLRNKYETPKKANSKEYVPRIKPFYYMTEKEVAKYAHIKQFKILYTECPHAEKAFRNDVRNALNMIENKHPGSKRGIINATKKQRI